MPETPEQENPEPDAPEMELCPECLHANIPGTHFCPECGSPLSSFATIGPWERIQAERHIFANAASRPAKLITVVGIWLVFGPIFASGTFLALMTLNAYFSALEAAADGFPEPTWGETLPGLLLGLSIAFVGGFVVVRTTLNYMKNKKTPP